jgi:sugar phosphate isomerase/epimerase
MAADLRVPIVTTHLGRIDDDVLRRGYLTEAIEQLADISDRTGTFIAFETGGADPGQLAEILRRINSATLGACYDPASVLIDGFDPMGGVGKLASTILIARARDAQPGSDRHPGREVPLGTGQVDMAEYLAMLDQAGYRNVPFIRHTESQHPLQDAAEAKRRLERIMK